MDDERNKTTIKFFRDSLSVVFDIIRIFRTNGRLKIKKFKNCLTILLNPITGALMFYQNQH